MDGNCHFLLFLLVVRFSFCHTCDCKLVDILRSIVQKEIMEREILAARVDILESKIGSDNRNGISSSGSQLGNTYLCFSILLYYILFVSVCRFCILYLSFKRGAQLKQSSSLVA